MPSRHAADSPVPALTLPPLAELLASAHVVSLPLTTRFRGLDVREALVMQGPHGSTEFSPFSEYGDEEAAVWLAAAIDFGWDAQPEPLRTKIPVNATIPAVAAADVAPILASFNGCRTAKIKVAETGQSIEDDVARVAEVRRLMGPEGRIRLDANGGWNVDEAEHAIRLMSVYDLEYVEQPCASVAELAEIRERVAYMDIPIAADESVRKAADPLAVARAEAVDLLVIKAQPLGGIRLAIELVEQSGLPAIVSSALDTSVGISMGAWLAATLPELFYDCGLGTASLLAADVTARPLKAVDGYIPVERVELDAALLAQYAAPADRDAWWRERLARCYAILEAPAA